MNIYYGCQCAADELWALEISACPEVQMFGHGLRDMQSETNQVKNVESICTVF